MKKIVSFVTLFLCAINLWSQGNYREISGKVIDEDNNALSQASVVLVGSKLGTQTDNAGKFVIKVPATGKIYYLSISYVGFVNKKIIISPSTQTVNIQLKRDQNNMEDVVVIGYQSIRRKDLVASVSSISSKDLKDLPINSAEQALTGKVTGVQVTSSEGSPDANIKIVVRGGISITQDNTPLYIIDGIPGDLSSISPQDIQSIDVLKDASATAIYGARGANGVVIVTTKSGRKGHSEVTYNGMVGVQKLSKKLSVLHPYDFVEFQYERSRYGEYIGNVDQSTENTFNTEWGSTFDTIQVYKKYNYVDWQQEMMGRNALIQTHNVNFLSGDDKTQYNLSLTNNSDDYILRSSGYNRNIINFKLDSKIKSFLKIGLIARYNDVEITGNGVSSTSSTAYNNLRQIIRYRPLLLSGESKTTYDADYYDETNSSSMSLINPIVLDQAQYKRQYTKDYNFSGYFDLTITPNISFRSTMGVDDKYYKMNYFEDSITIDAMLNDAGKPIVNTENDAYVTKSISNVLNYRFKVASHHNIDGVLGQELYSINTKTNIGRWGGYDVGISPVEAIGNLALATTFTGYPSVSETEATRLSFFGRLNYDYNSKYYVSLTMRADGSSKFASNNRWGYFPAISVAWKISQEKFMQALPFISDLKLRAGYGETGNDNISNYLYVTQYSASGTYGLSNSSVIGLSPSSLSNQYLKWETNKTRDIGLDAGFLQDRLSLTLDLYRNTANNLLINAPIPTSSGYSTQMQNKGAVTNQGIEVGINASIIQKRDFSWTANFNFSYNHNKIDRITPTETSYLVNSGALTGQSADFIVKKGEPIGSIYGYISDGTYKVSDFDATQTASGTYTYTLKSTSVDGSSIVGTPYPGTMKVKDITKDGTITTDDRTIIGNTLPKYTGGFNQTVQYKNFDLSLFINYSFGNKILNANKIEFTNAYTPDANVLSIANSRWRYIDPTSGSLITDPTTLTSMNKNAKMWIPSQGTGGGSFLPVSWAVESGSFIRFNNLTLGYSLPSSVLKRMKLSRFRMYMTLNNFALITSYSGYDPEVNTRRSTPATPGVDYSAYPRSRSYVFGVNVTF